MSDPQASAQAVLDEYVASGREIGLHAAAYYQGECVVDAWAGVADRDTGQPVTKDTLYTIFSASKGVTAIIVHRLADAGLLDYDEPIATYWPEFAANGKSRITVRQALTHQSAIPQMPDNAQPEDMCDWDAMVTAIAAHEPLWEPGTGPTYHAITFGWILGEVVRRVDSRPIAQILQEDLVHPLGLDGLYFGIPESEAHRVASLVDDVPTTQPADAPPPHPLSDRIVPPPIAPIGVSFNREDVRRASIPGAGGIANARSLARLYAATVGEVDGVRLLSPERLEIATEVQYDGPDRLSQMPALWGLGFGLLPMELKGSPTGFGHGGYGGTAASADKATGFAFSLTHNRCWTAPLGEAASERVAGAIQLALGLQLATV